MLFSNWLSSLKYHLLLRGNARARRGRRRARSTPELMQLEDLCLLSAFVPTFPTNPATVSPPHGNHAIARPGLGGLQLPPRSEQSESVPAGSQALYDHE